jgi:hypothetical protein
VSNLHVINAQQFAPPASNVFITNSSSCGGGGAAANLSALFGSSATYPASNTYHSAQASVIHLTNGGIANSSSSSLCSSSCSSIGSGGVGALLNGYGLGPMVSVQQPMCSLYQIAQQPVVVQKASATVASASAASAAANAAKRCFSFDDIEDDGFLP